MSVLIGIGAVLALAAVSIRVLENRVVYFPPRYPEGFVPPESLGFPVEEVWIMAEDGMKLNAWFFPNPNSNLALLWFHGNAENIGYGLGHLAKLRQLGVNILALDYRGYGKSEGSPDELGVYRDAEAAYREVVEKRRFEPKNVILYGRSLGGAVAIDLAARHDCGGLIVESSFTSGREMARRMFRIPLLEYVPKSRFDSLAKIRRVRAPVLIIHGTRDEVIPFSMGQRLFEAAPEPKSFHPVSGAGHNDVDAVAGGQYLEWLKAFVQPMAKVAERARL